MIKQSILISVDNIVFSIVDQQLQVLLIKRLAEPFKGMRALPG